jgi:hypothetical protein
VSKRDYYKVQDGNTLVGYTAPAAEMVGVWSVYNADAKKIAMVAPMEDAFSVMFYGRNQDATEQWINAKSFKLAVARIFRLEGLPRFDPKLPAIELGTAVEGSEAASAVAKSKQDKVAARADAMIGKILRSCPSNDARLKTLGACVEEAARLQSGGAAPRQPSPYQATAQAIFAKILESARSAESRSETLGALAAAATRQRTKLG